MPGVSSMVVSGAMADRNSSTFETLNVLPALSAALALGPAAAPQLRISARVSTAAKRRAPLRLYFMICSNLSFRFRFSVEKVVATTPAGSEAEAAMLKSVLP